MWDQFAQLWSDSAFFRWVATFFLVGALTLAWTLKPGGAPNTMAPGGSANPPAQSAPVQIP